MSDTVKVVYIGQADAEVPDIGTWKSGDVKDVDSSFAEWLLTGSDFFRPWSPAPEDAVTEAPKAKPAKPSDSTD